MITGMHDKWPDFLEVHRETEDGPSKLVFVIIRKNSRSLQADQLNMLRALEEASLLKSELRVVVRVGTVDLTLDQFEKGGVYGVSQAPTRVLAQSTVYGKQAELRRLENALQTLSPTDPNYVLILNRLEQVKSALGVNQTNFVSHDKLVESDKKLTELAEHLASSIPDDQLADVPTLSDLREFLPGIEFGSQRWKDLVYKWITARKAKYPDQFNIKETNNESKPKSEGETGST